MKPKKKRSFWPYLVAIASVLVAIILFAGLVLPRLMNQYARQPDYSTSEYTESEHALKSPVSYTDLTQTIKKHQPKDNPFYTYDMGLGSNLFVEEEIAVESVDDAVAESAIPKETYAASAAVAGDADYSDTNIRTEGVYEGDIVKTDGRYIYSIYPNSGKFTIADTQDKLKLVYASDLLDTAYYNCREFYVAGDKLYFTGSKDVYSYDDASRSGSWSGQSFLLTYDISDRSAPVLTDTYLQAGRYISARMVGNCFYLFTNYYEYDLADENVLPAFGGEKIACEDIYYSKYFTYPNFYCVGAVDLSDPSVCRSAKAVLTDNGEFYVSDKTIYVYSSNWVQKPGRSYSETAVVGIGYDKTDLSGIAMGTVPGYLNDSFSIDEYNGKLRLLTTIDSYTYHMPNPIEKWFHRDYDYASESENNNSLWILDDQLSLLSSIENIQENELVQSARFLGDVVYFVTFRNTDPLFAADLSDPANPKMLDGIQLTGFSNYLHFWDDGLLLGIGYEGDESGNLQGAKLSMFDITDPKNIREIDRYAIKENTSILSTDYSYKSVLVEPGKNLIGFATESYQYAPEDHFDGSIGTYYVFSYDANNGFEKKLAAELYKDNYGYQFYTGEYWIDYSNDVDEFEDEDYFDYEELDSWDEISSGSGLPNGISEFPTIEEPTTAGASIFEQFAKEAEPETSAVETAAEEDLAYEDVYMYLTTQYVRGLYINDQLYIVNPGFKIYQYDLTDMSLKDTQILYQPEKVDQ